MYLGKLHAQATSHKKGFNTSSGVFHFLHFVLVHALQISVEFCSHSTQVQFLRVRHPGNTVLEVMREVLPETSQIHIDSELIGGLLRDTNILFAKFSPTPPPTFLYVESHS